MEAKKKKFIVIEGCDGSGKSSVAVELAKEIGGVYYKTPSNPFWQIRQEIEKTKDYNLIFYFYLAGTLHSAHEIGEILKRNHVVCDRYYYTTLAYHRVLGVNIPAGLEELFIKPDYNYCLYANEEVVKERLSKRTILGPHDLKFDLQARAFEELKKFGLELFDTSDLTTIESTHQLLKKMNL